jgi:hypothetical protein
MHRDGAVATLVTTRDGRTLACLEVGDPQGPLVIHNHGGPSSRLEARLFAESASRNRLRLVCVDRTRHRTVKSAKGADVLGLGARHGRRRR